MATENYTAGDIVRLKSGGAQMTVQGFEKSDSSKAEESEADAHVRCVWMADDKVQTHVFPRDLLDSVRVEKDKGGQHDGVQRAIDRQDGTAGSGSGTLGNGMPNEIDRVKNPPRSGPAADEEPYKSQIHEKDGFSQTRGNFAESQPSQALEQPDPNKKKDDDKKRPIDEKRGDPKPASGGPGGGTH